MSYLLGIFLEKTMNENLDKYLLDLKNAITWIDGADMESQGKLTPK